METEVVRKRLAGACLTWIACLAAASLACTAVERARDAAARSLGAGVSTGTSISDATSAPSLTGEGVGAGAGNESSPELRSQARLRLAYPPGTEGQRLEENRAIGEDVIGWPEMRYLGEATEFAGRGYETVSVAPTEIRIVPGTSVPLAYSPELNEARPVPDGAPWGYGGYDKPLLFIPPNASLVMVEVETDPSLGVWSGPGSYECPEDGRRWPYSPEFFHVSYPGLGETRVNLTGDRFWFADYQSPRDDCPGNGWLYFIVPGVDLDPSLIWLEYTGHNGHGKLAFWTLTERP